MRRAGGDGCRRGHHAHFVQHRTHRRCRCRAHVRLPPWLLCIHRLDAPVEVCRRRSPRGRLCRVCRIAAHFEHLSAWPSTQQPACHLAQRFVDVGSLANLNTLKNVLSAWRRVADIVHNCLVVCDQLASSFLTRLARVPSCSSESRSSRPGEQHTGGHVRPAGSAAGGRAYLRPLWHLAL